MSGDAAPPDDREVMTVAALKENSWNVLTMRVPENPDLLLLRAGLDAALTVKDDVKREIEAGAADLEPAWAEIWRRIDFFYNAKLPGWPSLDELHEIAQGHLGYGLDRLEELFRDERGQGPDVGR